MNNQLAAIRAIRKQIMVLNGMITKIQDECKHENVTKVAGSDTGNWDRGTDSYWDDCKCEDCGKTWRDWKEVSW